jgi:hypothetical protein
MMEQPKAFNAAVIAYLDKNKLLKKCSELRTRS